MWNLNGPRFAPVPSTQSGATILRTERRISSENRFVQAWRPASPKGFSPRSSLVRVVLCCNASANACANQTSNWMEIGQMPSEEQTLGLNTAVTNPISIEVENSEDGIHLQHLSQCLQKRQSDSQIQRVSVQKGLRKQRALTPASPMWLPPRPISVMAVLTFMLSAKASSEPTVNPQQGSSDWRVENSSASASASRKSRAPRRSTVGRLFSFSCLVRASSGVTEAEQPMGQRNKNNWEEVFYCHFCDVLLFHDGIKWGQYDVESFILNAYKNN